MSNEWNLIELDDFGVLRLRGPDGTRFLQGQVSNDVERLTAERSLIAGYHNPQGRAIALLRLVQLAPDDLLAILPRELAAPVASRLGKFILRSKVKIADESGAWRLTGLVAPHAAGDGSNGTTEPGNGGPAMTSWAAAQFEEASARVTETAEQASASVQLEESDSVVELPTVSALMLPDALNAQSRSESTTIVRVGAAPARWLIVSPVGEAPPLSGCVTAGRDAWRILDIAAGVPQVYAATTEEFVAQMLNLDALGGISFEKGCYTGQEVIARAHYRGRVKRRLQRFLSRGPAQLAIAETGQLADGRAFKVVEAAQLPNGRCEFLAVAPMPAGGAAPGGGASGEAEGQAQPAGPIGGAAIDAEQLALPYALPD